MHSSLKNNFIYTICLIKFLNDILFDSRILIYGELLVVREIRRVVLVGVK